MAEPLTDVQDAIYRFILFHPNTTQVAILENIDIENYLLLGSLSVLEEMGKISSKAVGDDLHYYPKVTFTRPIVVTKPIEEPKPEPKRTIVSKPIKTNVIDWDSGEETEVKPRDLDLDDVLPAPPTLGDESKDVPPPPRDEEPGPYDKPIEDGSDEDEDPRALPESPPEIAELNDEMADESVEKDIEDEIAKEFADMDSIDVDEEALKDIDEIFIISQAGLLLSHHSTKQVSTVDTDILASMLTIVQNFVNDSMGSGKPIRKLGFADLQLMITPGEYMYMVIISSKDLMHLADFLDKLVADIEAEHGEKLMDYDGDQNSIKSMDDMIRTKIGIS